MDDAETIVESSREQRIAAAIHRATLARFRQLDAFTAFAGLTIYPFLWAHPHPAARWALMLLALAILMQAVLLLATGKRSWLGQQRGVLRWVVLFSAPTFLGVVVAAYFIGLFSPAIAPFGVAIHSLAQGPSRRVAVYFYLAIAVPLAVAMSAIALGALPDLGLFKPTMDRALAVGATVAVQVIFAAAWVFGRSSERVVEEEVLRETRG